MIQRCRNPNNLKYADYGGRGISVCARWRSFENFLADMGERPEGAELDRIDVNGDYEPSNCRWATRAEQNRNRRDTNWVRYGGELVCATELAARLGVATSTLRQRVRYNWPEERLGDPPRPCGPAYSRKAACP
jgi:hypothetical protein